MTGNPIKTTLALRTLKRLARINFVTFALIAIWACAPDPAIGQERLKIIYSQFTMSNSVTWFAREAGLFSATG